MTGRIMAGARIRNQRMPGVQGTLGCVVRSRASPGTLYVLTAGHVIGMNGYANPGDGIEAFIEGKWTKIAEFDSSTKLLDAVGAYQKCDAAIARITAADLVSPEIDGIGLPVGLATGLWEGMQLKLRGAVSGAISASIHSTGNELELEYENRIDNEVLMLHFQGQILYGTAPGIACRSVTAAGDSGALVVNLNNRAVGLHIAGTPGNYPVSASVCTPIQLVLDVFQVDLFGSPSMATTTTAFTSAAGASPTSYPDALGKKSTDKFDISIRSFLLPHTHFGGVMWELTDQGLVVNGKLERSAGALVTVPKVWGAFRSQIEKAALEFRVPVELIVATICTESGGDSKALRKEPGWTSDSETPRRVSAGLMQTLISSAREALEDPSISRDHLFDPETSIRAGTAFIKNQRTKTFFDPPLVACAYNAGSLRRDESSANRWKIHQHPAGTGKHADRFVQWFNDCFAHFGAQPDQAPTGAPSFWRIFRD